ACNILLPDNNSAFFGNIHFVTRLGIPRFVKSIQVNDWTYRTVLSWRVRIRFHLVDHKFIGSFCSPNCCPRQEEALVLCKTINQSGVTLVFEVSLQGVKRYRGTTYVTHDLPQSKTTVDKYTGHRLVSLELRYLSIGCGIKLRFVFFLPPIIKVSIAIVL